MKSRRGLLLQAVRILWFIQERVNLSDLSLIKAYRRHAGKIDGLHCQGLTASGLDYKAPSKMKIKRSAYYVTCLMNMLQNQSYF